MARDGDLATPFAGAPRAVPPSRDRPRRLALALALAWVALAPGAGAHEGEDHSEDGLPDEDGGFIVPPPDQGTAPPEWARTSYYSYYQSAFLYGTHTLRLLGDQFPRDLATDGEWIVWTDAARTDVYAFNLAAGDGFYVTEDTSLQRRPDVSGGVVVWEDARAGPSDILAYFLDTGETRRLSRGGDSRTTHQNPSIDGTWVAWEDDRHEDFQVYAYDMQTNQEMRVSHDDSARNTDPVVVGDYVVYRTYRFNVWDLVWFNLLTGETGSVTADRGMEMPPFRAGGRVLFLKESELGWRLHAWDPATRSTSITDVHFQNPTPPAADGDRVVKISQEGASASFVALNLSNGAATRVTGYIPMIDTPVLAGRTLHVPVFNGTKAALMSFTVSPFAFLNPPRLIVDAPEDGHLVAGGTVRVRGTLTYAESWGAPDAFIRSINGANHSTVVAAPEWSFDLDLRKARPGAYEVVVEAHYREAPTVAERFTVYVPAAFRGTDIARAGEEYHEARLAGIYYRFLGSNPAVVGLVALAAAVVALWVVRYRWTVLERRRGVIEYVRPPPE